jgi:hypothetical protein
MSGLHGKNAELRLSVSEAVQSGIALTAIGSDPRIYQAAVGKRDWKYGEGLTSVVVDYGGGVTEEIDPDSPYVHYPGGAVHLLPHMDPATISGIAASAHVMSLAGVSARPSATREFNVSIENPILDATVMGSTFKSKVMGIPDWKGSLKGLYINPTLWGLAIAGVSGITPRKVLRFRPDPLHSDTYFQGAVIFPMHDMSTGFDKLVEQNVNFEGDGPLQAVIDGVPNFPNI